MYNIILLYTWYTYFSYENPFNTEVRQYLRF